MERQTAMLRRLRTIAALALVAAIFITGRVADRPGADPEASVGPSPVAEETAPANVIPLSTAFELDMVLTADSFQEEGKEIPVLTPSPSPSPVPHYPYNPPATTSPNPPTSPHPAKSVLRFIQLGTLVANKWRTSCSSMSQMESRRCATSP